MTRLGVGLTHAPGLDRVMAACGDLLEVVEIEPQTLWRTRTDGEIDVDEEALRRLADLPGARLLHGIGNPVGGCLQPDGEQLDRFAQLAERLGTPWVSEHLAFNRVRPPGQGGGAEFRTGFMLPPRQTASGVRHSVSSVRTMMDRLPVPLAVEIGTNYLRPRPDELPDGEFVARVAEGAGCGLLLDLHNVLANERNGRGGVEQLLADLPLDRVWEVHLAGGLEHRGYWLDAHSGLPDQELLDLAARVLPRLPALRAVLFEVVGPAVTQLEAAEVRDLLVRVREMWPQHPAADLPRPWRSPLPAQAGPDPVSPQEGSPRECSPQECSPQEWEHTLGSLVIGRSPDSPLARELAADPALPLLRELVSEFRAGALVGTLVHTLRLLLLTLGTEGVRELLDGYTRAQPPPLFATQEAFAFADHLRRARPAVEWLSDVLELDLGLIRVQLDGEPQTVELDTEPTALLAALGAGRLPVGAPRGPHRVRLVDDRAPERSSA
ncbi:multinuclear nonheme iron-dependent oxidase [Kitasatospora azatica]|uniref:multinuclear nonheme iron-dependent oxidase n=1 Tax=Kitasatospora azatica TaxID=58347 RepID=UPI00068C2FFE|nr:DUF692 family multinuclear iron-containing protein [Kitasatospora azatica]